MAHKEFPIVPSTLEFIDTSLYSWVDETLNIHTTTNKGWKKVSTIWVSAERAYQVKNDKDVRDSGGSLILPLITIERSTVVKDPNKKGVFWGNITRDDRGGSITFTKRLNHDKTSNFANMDAQEHEGQINFPRKNDKIVYQHISMPMPVYVDITYIISLRTEYQQQMNEMITPFVTKTGGINHFTMKPEGHFFEGFIQSDLSSENNVSNMTQEERKYETKIYIKVLGYLIGEGKNQETPKMVIHENAVEVKIPREYIIYGDINEYLSNQQDIAERMQNITDT